MKIVLFLCTGNYYRSRFAEHLFNAVAEKDALPWRAASRGLAVGHAGNIGPISPFAISGLEARGIYLNGSVRFPLQTTNTDLEKAGLVVALREAEHRPMLLEIFPEWADRVEYWQIGDLDDADPNEALALLEDEVRALVVRLKAATMAAAKGDRRSGDSTPPCSSGDKA